jgi:hypothetical protein
MTNTDRFAIVPLHTGQQPSDDALMVGPLDLIMSNLPDTLARSDAFDRLEAARINPTKSKSCVRQFRPSKLSLSAMQSQ